MILATPFRSNQLELIFDRLLIMQFIFPVEYYFE